jgi:hypothetical protein
MTIKEFIIKANNIHRNKYDYSKSIYVNGKTKIAIKCPKHGYFQQEPRVHTILKHGCPQCAKEKFVMSNDEFLSRAKAIHHDTYDYSNTTYDRADRKVTIICLVHGEFKIRARSHLIGCGCQKCIREKLRNNLTLEQSEFIKRSNVLHKNKFDYSQVVYKNAYTKIRVICPIHGEFMQKPMLHLRGHGCKKCAIKNSASGLSKFIEKSSRVHDHKYDYSKSQYTNARSNIEIICPIHGSFQQLVSNHTAGSGCPYCPATISTLHQEVIDYIKPHAQMNINDRDIIRPNELDIYIPQSKLAIEVHGDYWHSWHPNDGILEDKQKHVLKFNECDRAGIKLLQIFEHEWNSERASSIWQSIIGYHINIANNICYARNCDLSTETKCFSFLNENHLQGYKHAQVELGLWNNQELISAMTFNKHSKYEWEIVRFATKKNHVVVGGASRLFSNFVKIYKPNSILTFADRRYSNGSVYKKLGFEIIGTTEPGYVYIDHGKILSRYKCQKHKLKKLLPIYDDKKSESENMFANKYRRLYNAGNYKFLWKC